MKTLVNILGLSLNKRKKVKEALTLIFGIGKKRSEKLLKVLGFKKALEVGQLEKESVKEIPLLLEFLGLKLKGDLREALKEGSEKLVRLRLVRGIRGQKG